jgi:uncharacterized protein (DUF885 family)
MRKQTLQAAAENGGSLRRGRGYKSGMDPSKSSQPARWLALAASLAFATCKGPGRESTDPAAAPTATAPATSSAAPVPAATAHSTAFRELAREVIDDTCRYQPTTATFLGIHDYDDQLEDYSKEGVYAETAAMQRQRAALASVDPKTLSPSERLDLQQLVLAVDARLLALTVVRPWMKSADLYSSGITNTAYIMIKREFAPKAVRLRQLIARERRMPAALLAARKNLLDPPRVFTEVALEQIDGNRDFFATVVPAAFVDVDDKKLLAELGEANAAVLAAFDDYKKWLQDVLLARSTGEFALGEETYRKKLWTEEMVDTPLGELLRVAEEDLHKNQRDFVETAARIDPARTPSEVLAALQAGHPRAEELIATTQAELDSIAAFLTGKGIVTIPAAAPARVQETPPFMRAMTFASMDTPGPFERVATEAYYSMTLPDPAGTAADTEEFMKQWYPAAITNVSVHEVWPGHYLQFLHAPNFPSDVRRVFSANTNVEGWAHYCEQMMVEEGFHDGDPKWRLAQLQDALLRDARFVVGIRLHTQKMTLDEARQFFMTEAFQPKPVAVSETKRGTSDAIYGYYTLGKLMILKLRDDVKAKRGARFRLQEFHDEFLGLGPLPLPLMRKAMLGETGRVL